jgi:hypothetical protein
MFGHPNGVEDGLHDVVVLLSDEQLRKAGDVVRIDNDKGRRFPAG